MEGELDRGDDERVSRVVDIHSLQLLPAAPDARDVERADDVVAGEGGADGDVGDGGGAAECEGVNGQLCGIVGSAGEGDGVASRQLDLVLDAGDVGTGEAVVLHDGGGDADDTGEVGTATDGSTPQVSRQSPGAARSSAKITSTTPRTAGYARLPRRRADCAS